MVIKFDYAFIFYNLGDRFIKLQKFWNPNFRCADYRQFVICISRTPERILLKSQAHSYQLRSKFNWFLFQNYLLFWFSQLSVVSVQYPRHHRGQSAQLGLNGKLSSCPGALGHQSWWCLFCLFALCRSKINIINTVKVYKKDLTSF